MGRFSTTIIKKNKGFNRIFTILARGYLFHNADGTLRTDDSYERTEEARRFLCAWCSLPYETVSNKGSATYMESYEGKLPEGFMEKKPEMGGVSAVRINL